MTWVPYINFGLLATLAVVAVIAAVLAFRKLDEPRWLIAFLSLDFIYVSVFIWFSFNTKPDVWWLDIGWGRMAYWPLYTSLIVAFLSYTKTLLDDDIDDEIRRIVEQNQ